MATVVEVPCPHCEQNLKVPDTVFGKKVRCKHCELAFVVEDPAKKPPKPSKPAKPAPKPEPKAAAKQKAPSKPAASPPPPPPEPAKSPFMDDEEEAKMKVELIKEEDVPRCPHCAKELDPPDAKVCLNCGFNNLTRERAEVKRVVAATNEDWFMHLFPGIFAVVLSITLIGLNIWFIMNVREWMIGSIVDMDEKDAAGRPKFYVHPGAFIFAIGIISLRIVVPSLRFAYRRLVLDYKPEEKVKK
ncbi:MAG: hypothetical protein C0467_15960 [Planctomycetaceae bacterium]|nr:hypothetical protein [Planctomycetaceae bacterium]